MTLPRRVAHVLEIGLHLPRALHAAERSVAGHDHLRRELPQMFGKEKKKQALLNDLPGVFRAEEILHSTQKLARGPKQLESARPPDVRGSAWT